MSADPLITADGFRSAIHRRKRLGQYFTDRKLARFLAALAGAEGAAYICDPMAGQGDMLLACIEQGAVPERLDAVEIDPEAYSQLRRNIDALVVGDRADELVLGDAFSPETVRRLHPGGYDLVITNPPYVRYQSASRSAGVEAKMPTAKEIRRGLLRCLDVAPGLDPEDRKLFDALTERYSGLADLAVPSWLLAAALVRQGGTLAMVLPEAWLTRDYAWPVKYLLGRWFEVQFLVEDIHAAWFEDALVKTTLLVARRVVRRENHPTHDLAGGYLHIRLPRQTIDDRSVVGALAPASASPDRDFAKLADQWLEDRDSHTQCGATATWVAHHRSNLVVASRALLKPDSLTQDSAVSIPVELAGLVEGDEGTRAAFTSLEDTGWRVGQGLRTGANDFFYVERTAPDGSAGRERVRSSALFNHREFDVPTELLLPVVRRQSDLPQGMKVQPARLDTRVLIFDGHALPEDLKAQFGTVPSVPVVQDYYRPIEGKLAAYIRTASRQEVTTGSGSRKIPELSAVAPNVRGADPSRPGTAPRFWYMLPPITDRHRPSLLMPRVQGAMPRTYLNPGRAAVVDANFSTLWPVRKGSHGAYALLALFNSTWNLAVLELTGSIMGGGALKVEASHLRRIPLPALTDGARQDLSRLGQSLISVGSGKAEDLLGEVDRVVAACLVGPDRAAELVTALQAILAERRAERAR